MYSLYIRLLKKYMSEDPAKGWLIPAEISNLALLVFQSLFDRENKIHT